MDSKIKTDLSLAPEAAGYSCHSLCTEPGSGLWHVGWIGTGVPQAILESYGPERSELSVLVSRQLRCLARRLPRHLTKDELDALPLDLLLFLK